MPSYAPAPPKTRDAAWRRYTPRALSLNWSVRRQNTLGTIRALRTLPTVPEELLNEAQAELDALHNCQSNTVYGRAFRRIENLLLCALGVRGDHDAPTPARKDPVDTANPPIGLRFLVNLKTFVIERFEPGHYPRPNRIHGRYVHAPETDVTLDSKAYSFAIQECADTYGWELDNYLVRFHARANNLRKHMTYAPARGNRTTGPTSYQITGFVDMNRLQVWATGPGGGKKIITVAQWKAWNDRTRTRASTSPR